MNTEISHTMPLDEGTNSVFSFAAPKVPPNLDSEKRDLVLFRRESASLPVLITAPHGGCLKFGKQSEQFLRRDTVHSGREASSSNGAAESPPVVTKGDLYTLDLLTELDAELTRLTGHRPYVVAARFHRRFVDANRNRAAPEEVAVNPDCPSAAALYDHYHAAVDACVAHALTWNPGARLLVLDVHGQARYLDHIVLGTCSVRFCF